MAFAPGVVQSLGLNQCRSHPLEHRGGRARAAFHARLGLLALGLASCVGGPEPAAAPTPGTPTRLLTKGDLRALDHLENAQVQLDEWCGRLAARLRTGESPRDSEPALDGTAARHIRYIRESYAQIADDKELSEAMLALARAHEKRLAALADMAETGLAEGRYTRLDAEVERLVTHVRSWRKR